MKKNFLTQAKIKVRLNITRPIITELGNTRVVSIIGFPIKDFSDPIDWNKLADLRGMGNSGTIATRINAFINNYKNNVIDGRGNSRSVSSSGAYASYLLYNDENNLQSEFGRYKNWFREEVKEGRIKSKVVDKPLMITFSTEDLLYESFDINNFNQYPRAIRKIQDKFFEILDSVDIFYNAKELEVAKRILKRYEDNGENIVFIFC